MSTQKTHIAFDPDTMTIRDLKKCADALAGILYAFDKIISEHPDWGPAQAEEFAMRVLQVANGFTNYRKDAS